MFGRISDPGLVTTILCASLILSACGGGGSDSGSSGTSSSSGGDATTLKPGLYDAKIEYVGLNRTESATTYLSPTGDFSVVYGGDAGVSVGKLSFDGATISGTSSDYRQQNDQPNPEGFIEDKHIEEGTISGTILSQGSARFSTSDTEGKVNTNVTLRRQNAPSDWGISLKRVSGIYTYVDPLTDELESTATLAVREDGSLDAHYHTQTTNCQLIDVEPKSLSVPNTSINVFDITYKMSSCSKEDRNGEYSGIGFFVPGDQQTQILFTAHNGTVAMKFKGIQ